jgi:DNA-binding beta-propeller fold protein YncE
VLVPLARNIEAIMALKNIRMIGIPDSAGSSFDHGAFDPATRRVFVAHTGRSRVEVIDHDAGKHIATLSDFPQAAGVVAGDGAVLVTNRGAASVAWLDARSLETVAVFKTGPRPNGIAIVPRHGLAIVASIGDETQRPRLEVLNRDGPQHTVDLPGQPRWCVTDAAGERVFLAIREPSMIFVARLPGLNEAEHWGVPAAGAHGLDINHTRGRLYVACDAGVLVELDISAGAASGRWRLAGAPDVTFFNPVTGFVHVAIGEPGLIQTIDPHTGSSSQTMTGLRAHTTAIVPPDRLYVFSPPHCGALDFMGA